MDGRARDRSTHFYGDEQGRVLPVLEVHTDRNDSQTTTRMIGALAGRSKYPDEATKKPQSTGKTPGPSKADQVQSVVPAFAKRSGSVWSDYKKSFDIDFGDGILHVASRRKLDKALVFVQECRASEVSARLSTLTQTQSSHFVKCLDCFVSPFTSHFVFEPMNMSLMHVTKARRSPTEQEIVAIVGQVSSLHHVF